MAGMDMYQDGEQKTICRVMGTFSSQEGLSFDIRRFAGVYSEQMKTWKLTPETKSDAKGQPSSVSDSFLKQDPKAAGPKETGYTPVPDKPMTAQKWCLASQEEDAKEHIKMCFSQSLRRTQNQCRKAILQLDYMGAEFGM